MDLDARHCELRKSLDVLGFGQPLPLGAIGIVSAILDDLIQTTEKLKGANQQIDQLTKEKTAWDLGVEPYKCDNSRLLAECNELHLQIIKQKDKYTLANTELRCKVRSLQADRRQMEEKCLQAEAKVRELQLVDSAKLRKDGANMQRKPFVSTVRPGYYQPPKCCEQTQMLGTGEMKCRCPCNQLKKVDVLQEIERLQVETKNQLDVITALKKQIEFRDREIERLGNLFAGGRPTTALAKDCCYRSVNVLADDVEQLQREKLAIQNKYMEAQDVLEKLQRKIAKMTEKNHQLEQELRDIEKVALNVESEANMNILERERKNSELHLQLQQCESRIRELQIVNDAKSRYAVSGGVTSSESSLSADSILQNALKQATEEKRELYKQLNELKQREQTFLTDYEKIKSKYARLKQKLSATQQSVVVANPTAEERTELLELQSQISGLTEVTRKAKIERDQCSSEAATQRQIVSKLKRESVEKDLQLKQLESELNIQRKANGMQGAGPRLKTTESAISAHSSLSVQSAFHRVERERDAAKREVQQLEADRDALRNKLKLATKSQLDVQAKHEELITNYSSQIAKLESEKRDLLSGRCSSQTSMHLLKEENRELMEKLKSVEDSYQKLKITHSQLKILQEQTERSLSQHQNRLMCSENQLDSAEAKLHQVDNCVESAQKEVGNLKGEISILKASNVALGREKDKLLMELDKKTEQLFAIEGQLGTLKSRRNELHDTVGRLQRKLDNVSTDNIQKESTLRSATSEAGSLKQQVATLKRTNDNAITENGRLSNELTDAVAELALTKRKLKDSQQEVERMKSQLREYVQEIQRAEELLFVKEREREEMLEHYKSLSEGVNLLESSNHTLEAESMEARKLLQEAEGRINGLQEQVGLRESEVKEYERQINELSANLVAVESEMECLRVENRNLQVDLEATKDLCSKLDLQKDRLNAELEEHSTIREQLGKENELLKQELALAQTDDQAAIDGLQELLAASRSDVEQQRILVMQRNQEVTQLRQEVETLRSQLADEQTGAARTEALANEYGVQVQELRRMITDDRFAQIQSRELHEDSDYNSTENRSKEVQATRSQIKENVSVEKQIAKMPENDLKLLNESQSLSETSKNTDASNETYHPRKEQATQKFESKLSAPEGWKIVEYKRNSSVREKRTHPVIPANTPVTVLSYELDELPTSSRFPLGARLPHSRASSSSSSSMPSSSSSFSRTGPDTLRPGDRERMDDIGSTVVIYKSRRGERLILRNEAATDADGGDRNRRNRHQARKSSSKNSKRPIASSVMIINEPKRNLPAAVGPGPTVTATWNEILRHHQSPGATAGTSNDSIMTATETAATGAETRYGSDGPPEDKGNVSFTSGHTTTFREGQKVYRMQFNVKVPVHRDKQ